MYRGFAAAVACPNDEFTCLPLMSNRGVVLSVEN
jgi:hypothetical protein